MVHVMSKWFDSLCD